MASQAAATDDIASGLPPPPAGRQAGVAYAIFEGGGARGITHIGAVKAIERERIEIIGVAGASAGAMVAALVAAGFSADTLYNAAAGTDLLSVRHQTPINLLGDAAWTGFRRLQARLGGAARSGRSWLIGGVLVCLVAVLGLGRAGFVVLLLALGLLGLWLWPLARQLQPLLTRLGLFDTRPMADEFNTVLREQLRRHYDANGETDRVVPDVVTFADLDPVDGGVRQCRRLKIVVSDVAAGTVRIFDRNTPAVAVADAVAASASIPLFFMPPRLRGAPDAVLADGGLVSNLPVWVFAADKRRHERDLETSIPILAFKLEDQPPVAATPAPPPGGLAKLLGHINRVVRTGIFGSQSIIANVLPDVVPVALPSRLGTFEFDVGRAAANAAFTDGFRAATETLARRRLEQQILDVLLAGLRDELLARVATLMPGVATRIRVSLLDPDRRYTRAVDSFRIVANAGMAGDADQRLSIDSRSRGAPSAWVARRPVYVEGLLQGDARSRHMTVQEDALVWRDLKSLIAMPIFAQPEFAGDESQHPQRILCIDADTALAPLFADTAFMTWLGEQTVLLSYKSIEEEYRELVGQAV